MKLSTKAALASGARKVIAVLFSTVCSAQLVDHWYDWCWVGLFFVAQWAMHFELERLILRKRLRELRKQPINQAINVSVPELSPNIKVVVPSRRQRKDEHRARAAARTESVAAEDPAPTPSQASTPPTARLDPAIAEVVRAKVAAEPVPTVLQRLSQIDISSFGRIFSSSSPETEETDDPEDVVDDDEVDAKTALLNNMRREELISAMKNLGYRSTAESIADYVISDNPDADLETLIRAALQLSRKK